MTAVADIFELLPLHALGALDDDEADAVERAVAADPALRIELERWRDTAARIGDALVPAPAPATVRSRLLADVGTATGPARFAAQVARLFDVDVSRAHAVLAQIDDARAWTTMAPGIRLLGVQPGPRHDGAQCALLRVAPGARFPWHAHLGEEVALVVHGGARMADGRQVVPGDEVTMGVDGDDAHDFVADAGADDAECIFAVRGHGIRLVPRPT